MSKKVLVTGSEGFIGSHLVEKLLKKKYNVKALILYNSFSNRGWLEKISKKNKNLNVIFGDLTSFDLMKNITKNCDKIFHLGAQISIPYSYKTPESAEIAQSLFLIIELVEILISCPKPRVCNSLYNDRPSISSTPMIEI